MKKNNVKKCAKINRLTSEAIQSEITRLEMKTNCKKRPGQDQTGSRYYAALVAERNARLGTPASPPVSQPKITKLRTVGGKLKSAIMGA